MVTYQYNGIQVRFRPMRNHVMMTVRDGEVTQSCDVPHAFLDCITKLVVLGEIAKAIAHSMRMAMMCDEQIVVLN